VDLSPVSQAVAPFVAGLVVLVIGLFLPRPLKKIGVAAGFLLAFGAAAAAGIYVGLGLACQSWDEHPQATWIGLISLLLLTATTVMAKSSRVKHKRDEDEDDDDGGLAVRAPTPPPPAAPAPSPVPLGPPGGPGPDWGEFDDLRQDWAVPAREPVGV
jgi:hypothetical protein